MIANNIKRERRVYLVHSLAGIFIALPILSLVGDWLFGAPEAFLFMLFWMVFASNKHLLLFIIYCFLALSGYWMWTGDSRRHRFILAWYGGAALVLAPFWPFSSINPFTLLLAIIGTLIIVIALPAKYWR
ncbi:MAG TPA: hypothetical protein PKY50_13570 [Candidatus Competibacter sp.]|nr:hypothetical protein [Candidatus Competibacter sp.]